MRITSKILLISPSDVHVDGRLKGGVWHAPPLGLAYIAAVLENEGHEVRIVDFGVESIDIKDFCIRFDPDVIGISCTTPTLSNSLLLAKSIKNVLPNRPIVFGGVHPTVFPKQLLKEKFIDFVIFGEGEQTMSDLVSHMNSDGRFDKILGLAYKKGKRIIQNEPRSLLQDLDNLPFPARHLLKIYRYPDHPYAKEEPGTTILTSRGCPGECIFCDKNVFGRIFRARTPKNILDEIEFLVEEYNMKEIAIVDDAFTLNRKRAIEICRDIVEHGLDISWMAPNGIRVDTISEELAYWMKKSGCHLLFFGIESGKQKILDNVRKGITLEQVRQGVKTCKKFGIDVGGFFMIGLPNETSNDVRDTLKFAKSLNLDAAKFGITVPLPGTELFDSYKSKGFITETDFSKYFWHTEPVFETNLLSKEEMMYWYKQTYKEFYLNPKYFIRRLRKMNSIKEIKNNLNGMMTVIKSQLSNI